MDAWGRERGCKAAGTLTGEAKELQQKGQGGSVEQVGAEIKGWRRTKGACSKTNPRSREPEGGLPPWRYGWKRAGGSSELLEVDLGGG